MSNISIKAIDFPTEGKYIQATLESKPDMVDLIFEFNREILGVKQSGVRMLSKSETIYLRSCLVEESDELQDAYDSGDVIKQVDACLDSLYFAIGGLYRMGLSADQVRECLAAVHAANMEKKRGVNSKRDFGIEDAVKPIDWVAPEERIASILQGD